MKRTFIVFGLLLATAVFGLAQSSAGNRSAGSSSLTGVYGWGSPPDTGLSRTAAGTVGVGNGSAGDTSGTITAMQMILSSSTTQSITMTDSTAGGKQWWFHPRAENVAGRFGLYQATDNYYALEFDNATASLSLSADLIKLRTDVGLSRTAASVLSVGNGGVGDTSGILLADGQTTALTADWTCGTSATVSSCATAVIIGSGGGVPLTFTLPLLAHSWTLECDLVVGQATAATANSWNLLTATNGATNVTAKYDMHTAAAVVTGGATTDQASTTTTFLIGPTWTLGATGTKMPVHIWARVEGASASGTVLSLQLVAPTAADVVTIYRGSSCRIR